MAGKAYSKFGIGVNREHKAKWRFHQENGALQYSQKVNLNSEIALSHLATSWQLVAISARRSWTISCRERPGSDLTYPNPTRTTPPSSKDGGSVDRL
jgi:hypothetical protein